jgi:hypothetical protein
MRRSSPFHINIRSQYGPDPDNSLPDDLDRTRLINNTEPDQIRNILIIVGNVKYRLLYVFR